MGRLILAAESWATDFNVVGSNTMVSGESDATLSIISFAGETDVDGDGVIDTLDAFPTLSSEWADQDNDGIGNNADEDDDDDGVLDLEDAFPLDFNEWADSDSDGVGDFADAFPNHGGKVFDLDLNGLEDIAEFDADKDGLQNVLDLGPFDPNVISDLDHDGLDDFADLDDDGDGINDDLDPAPNNSDDPILTFNAFNPFNTEVFKDAYPYGFSQISGSNAGWVSALDQSQSGLRSLSSRVIGDNQTAGLQYDGNFEAGDLSFHYKIDSERSADQLIFSIDGFVLLSDSGEVDWSLFTVPVTGGAHSLTWEYSKNDSGADGRDAVWIDNVSGPPPASIDLVLTVSNNQDVLESGGRIEFLVKIKNESESPTALAGFHADIPLAFADFAWTCTKSTRSIASHCASIYTNARLPERSVAGGSAGGNVSLDVLVDIGARETLEFLISGSVQSIEPPVTLAATVSAAIGIREDDLSNNTDSSTVAIFIFGSGFE